MKTHQVYILVSEKHGRYYTGISTNADERLIHHNRGMNHSTRTGIPWQRVWLSEPLTKTEALALERKIKKRGAGRYLNDINE